MTIRFIHPPLGGPVTGGNRYNREMVGTARRLDIPLDLIEWSGQSNLRALLAQFDLRQDLLLWDSIFLPQLALGLGVDVWSRQGMLVHYLPEANPLLHESERTQWRQRFHCVAERMRFLVATGVRIADHLRQQYPECAVFLREPVIDPVFRQLRWRQRNEGHCGPVRLITVANLLPAKRQFDLLEWLAAIDSDWQWHLAGEAGFDPNYARRFRRRVRELGLSHKVVWHGSLVPEQLAGLMSTMDLFVSCSAFESYGMALAEAAAMGLPILTTAVGEAERLLDGHAGKLIIPVGRPDLFAEALARWLTDKPFRIGLECRAEQGL